MKKTIFRFLVLVGFLFVASCEERDSAPAYDVIIRGGTVYDGSGGAGVASDIALSDDRIMAIGDLSGATAKEEIDATGMAVAPGFINMLSWAVTTLLDDGRGLSDIKQGVTLEVFGEGWSMGPLPDDPDVTLESLGFQSDQPIRWKTLGGYLDHMEKEGVSPNVASFVGATTLRIHQVGHENRAATPAEMDKMKSLVREAMEEGAMGLGSSLIYPPAFYAPTEELIELSRVVGEYGGMYISHMRSEGNSIEEAMDELITIAREAGVPAEIYHLKMAGKNNWNKFDRVVSKIESARAEGLAITADMYTYTAGGTGLTATMPPWASEGGLDALVERLKDPESRARIIRDMKTPSDEWENMLLAAGPEGILLNGFMTEALAPYMGKRLSEVAKIRGKSPEETAADLVIEDHSRIEAMYFMMSEENVRREIILPWLSFGSDAEAVAPEGTVIESPTHPRAYGNFARVLGKYVRDEKLMSLGEAIRKLTSLPAENLKLKQRGRLKQGYFADIVIFDPATIQDHATFEKPHQLATGMAHVFVNGTQVLRDGEHTGATPGRFVKGPGYKNK